MAQRVQTILVDDLDGTELRDGDGTSVKFSVGSNSYELDLSDENLGKFYDALEPYTSKARRTGGRGSTGNRAGTGGGARRVDQVDNKAVRAWASSNGIELSARGRIPADVVAKYRAAGN